MSNLANDEEIEDNTFYDSDDEPTTADSEQEKNLKRQIYWLTDVYTTSNKLKVDELILADGPIASAFTFTYLLAHLKSESKLIALTGIKSEFNIHQLNNQNTQSQTQDNQQYSLNRLRASHIYHVENLNGKSYLVCQLYQQLKTEETYDWIDQLAERAEFAASTLLCSKSQSTYLGTTEVQNFPCVKYLSSSSKTNDSKNKVDEMFCSQLEEPNFINDLPAAVIHYSVLKKLQFNVYICYSSSISPDVPSLKAIFNGITKNSTINNNKKEVFTDNEDSRKMLLSLDKIVNSVSGLYM